MPKPQYNLTLDQVLVRLREELAKHKAEPRGQLDTVSADDAWDHGYACCIRDVESLMGLDPRIEYNDAVTRLAEMEKQ